MNKEFVPYEIALTLKELGFNEPCISFYTQNAYGSTKDQIVQYWIEPIAGNDDYVFVLAPLRQQVFRWFREKHYKHGWVTESYFKGKKLYQYHISRLETLNIISDTIEDFNEAELACLKKLIEIVNSE